VVMDNGEEEGFDYLMLCTGSTYNMPFKEGNVVMSARGNTLSKCFRKLSEAKKILIIGGGIVGVEVAAEIVERFPEKELVIVHGGSHLMNRSQIPPKAVKYAEDFFKSRQVKILSGERVVGQKDTFFTTDQGKKIESDMAFLCTGIKCNVDLLKTNFAGCLNSEGMVNVTNTLQLQNCPNIFVAGDIINMNEEKLAQNAEASAHCAVNNIMAFSQNRKLKEYGLRDRPKIVSLGKYDGIAMYKNFSVTGFIPALMKEFVEYKVMTSYQHRSGKLWTNY